jgi:hypothetical protein
MLVNFDENEHELLFAINMLALVLSRKISRHNQTETILEGQLFNWKLLLSRPDCLFLERKLNTTCSGQGAKGYI